MYAQSKPPGAFTTVLFIFVLNKNNLNIYKHHSPYNRLMLGFHNINRVMEEKNLARSVIRAIKASEWNWKH